MLIPEFTRKFVKDFSLMQRRHKNIDKILEVISLIIWEEPLPAKYREHNLSGDYEGYTECHVEGDLLLIYRLPEGKVIFSRTGTHSDLF
jgi:mRNA interferase YafQ